MSTEQKVSLAQEVEQFRSAADQVALGDLAIRKQFAKDVMLLFAIANVFVLIGLGVVFWMDCAHLAAGVIKPSERVISEKVIMSLLAATTVQLGTVIFTIARAIFPVSSRRSAT